MKVSKLREKLAELDDDDQVYIEDGEGSFYPIGTADKTTIYINQTKWANMAVRNFESYIHEDASHRRTVSSKRVLMLR